MDSELNYTVDWKIPDEVTELGIYHVNIILEAHRFERGFQKRFSSNEVFLKEEEYRERTLKKVLEKSQLLPIINRKFTRKNKLVVKIEVIKFLSNAIRNQPQIETNNQEWQNIKSSEENTKPISTTLPSGTNSASMSLHRSMSTDDF